MVYAPDVPLRDLMTALTEALPMLEWRMLRPAPDAPPEYLLQARRPDPPRPTERTPAQRIQAIRLVLPFYPFRLREFTPYRSPYHDAFIIGRGAAAVDPQVAEPNPNARRRILQSENQLYALIKYLQDEEAYSIERERFSERWVLQLRCGDLTTEWELTERTPNIDWLWEE